MGRTRLASWWYRALVGFVLAGALACEDRKERAQGQPEAGLSGSASSATRNGAAPATGLRLTLPDGWNARPEAPERLAFGPGRRTVAWLERSASSAVPSPEMLREQFNAALSPASPSQVGEGSDDGASWWMGRVQPENGAAWTVGLCARQVGGGLYVMGTVPGAKEAEVRAAVEVCRTLRWED